MEEGEPPPRHFSPSFWPARHMIPRSFPKHGSLGAPPEPQASWQPTSVCRRPDRAPRSSSCVAGRLSPPAQVWSSLSGLAACSGVLEGPPHPPVAGQKHPLRRWSSETLGERERLSPPTPTTWAFPLSCWRRRGAPASVPGLSLISWGSSWLLHAQPVGERWHLPPG